MPFEKIPYPSFSKKESKEQPKNELESYLREKAEEFRRIGIPLSENDFRIETSAYAEIYSPESVEADSNWVSEQKKKFEGEPRERAELFERYVCCLFNKHLGERIIVVRTSEYDDLARHVDNVAVDREKGRVICTLDEVGTMRGPTYEKKRQAIQKRNIGVMPGQGGANLKYGFTLERNPQGELKARLSSVKHVPIFYLAISPEALERAVSEFTSSKEATTQYEAQILEYFLTSIESQIQGLMLEEKNLHPELKNSLLRFQEIVREVK